MWQLCHIPVDVTQLRHHIIQNVFILDDFRINMQVLFGASGQFLTLSFQQLGSRRATFCSLLARWQIGISLYSSDRLQHCRGPHEASRVIWRQAPALHALPSGLQVERDHSLEWLVRSKYEQTGAPGEAHATVQWRQKFEGEGRVSGCMRCGSQRPQCLAANVVIPLVTKKT